MTAYEQLTTHLEKNQDKTIKQLFSENPRRAEEFAVKTEHLYYDFSRQRVSPHTIKLLIELANELGLRGKIHDMFAGKPINQTEKRPVLHTALRNLDEPLPEVQEVLDRIANFSNEVHSGQRAGVTGKQFNTIIAIGIGGSFLGPDYLATALGPYAKRGLKLIFVANVDGTDFKEQTTGVDREKTLVVIVSKTFTTAETMLNAQTAKNWMLEGLAHHPDTVKKHFIAVSTAQDKVIEFGIDPANMFGFWDWVGGRFSATSAVGAVPLSLYLGFDNFRKILEGANWMDKHFYQAPLEQNIPVLAALIDVWNINFLGCKTRALLPYSQGLAKLPAHTQQVEMESNGKSVTLNGKPVSFDTGEVVFGEPGTNGQHSFYQLLHQGTQIIPCDFIGFIKPQYQVGQASETAVTHHEELMTNFLAQPDALAFGQISPYPEKNFPGNRPSSSLLLQELTPFTAGLLLALTEHRAAVKGFIWGINSFDQFGVELGKVLGKDQRRRIMEFHKTGQVNVEDLNPSTATLLDAVLRGNLP